jgi:hypothetical protein
MQKQIGASICSLYLEQNRDYKITIQVFLSIFFLLNTAALDQCLPIVSSDSIP